MEQLLDKILSSRHPLVRFCILSICGLFMWGWIFLWSTVTYILCAVLLHQVGITMSLDLDAPSTFLFTLCVLSIRAALGRIRNP
jgi:hypothetical protein